MNHTNDKKEKHDGNPACFERYDAAGEGKARTPSTLLVIFSCPHVEIQHLKVSLLPMETPLDFDVQRFPVSLTRTTPKTPLLAFNDSNPT
jgi:hypothetical protein